MHIQCHQVLKHMVESVDYFTISCPCEAVKRQRSGDGWHHLVGGSMMVIRRLDRLENLFRHNEWLFI